MGRPATLSGQHAHGAVLPRGLRRGHARPCGRRLPAGPRAVVRVSRERAPSLCLLCDAGPAGQQIRAGGREPDRPHGPDRVALVGFCAGAAGPGRVARQRDAVRLGVRDLVDLDHQPSAQAGEEVSVRTGPIVPRRILIAALCLAGWAAAAAAAPRAADDKVRWLFQATSGVTAMRLGGIKDAFREELGFFNANGVPIEAEREYPANLQFGADVMVGGRSRWLVGIGSSYTWTHAYALYADSNGTLDVKSKVDMWTLVSVLHWSSLPTRGWGAFGELRLGRAFATSDQSEQMV